MTCYLVFFVNGKKIVEKNPDPECILLVYLRTVLHLCGTKLGCGEGGCGACTVMLSRFNRITKEIENIAVNACLIPICSLHGCAIITIEGIGSTRTRLHPVQERLAKAHGSQCGFCTPGIIMSMYTLLRNSNQPSMADMEIAFQGNLCRCTGYRPILEGYKTFSKEFCNMGKDCCKNQKNNDCLDSELFEKNDFQPYDPTQEPLFPPELQLNEDFDKEFVTFVSKRSTWYRPLNLEELLRLKNEHRNAKIVVGNTEIGIEIKFRNLLYPHMIHPILIKELNEIREINDGLFIGAAVSLTNIEKYLKKLIQELPEENCRFYQCVVNMLFYFAGKQTRNVGCLGGNIMTGSPISDMNPILCSANALLTVGKWHNNEIQIRQIIMNENFFTGYRQNCIEPQEVLIGINFPKTNSSQYFKAFKQARRRDDDIAIVTIAMYVSFVKNTDIIENVNIAFGGMGATTVISKQSINMMTKQKWNRDLIEHVVEALNREFPLRASATGGLIAFRRSLVISLFFKCYLMITEDLIKNNILNESFLPENEKSGTKIFHTPILKSSQLFEKVNDNQSKNDPIGRPKLHTSALKQSTGEAIYCDDIIKMDNELYLGLLLSTRAHANILAIDAIDALAMDGVHAFFSASDLTEDQNTVGPVFHDEEVFVSKKIQCCGQVIGAIIADSQVIARRAVSAIRIVYEDLKPLIVSTEDAIENNSYFPNYPIIRKCGNVDEAFENSDHIIEGKCRIGGQEHFYLETHAALAIPRDTDEIELFCSTQHPSEIQKLVAHVLSIPSSRVVCRAKRLGGGFGGKESRGLSVALPVAFAAYRLKRPIRCMLDRDEDMMITGNRHPFLFKYKVGCTKDGLIIGCEIECYANAGWSMDLSFSVLDRAMNHFTNCYRIPNIKCSGWLCKTNLPSNTAFRGFGGPQGMFAAEHIIRDVAHATGINYLDIMQLNFFKPGDRTFYNQQLESFPVERCFQECLIQSNYHAKKVEIDEFNEKNRWRKRGIALVPTMYGIAFGVSFLNQAGALINIYTDGSVLLSHGGVEIGQGLYTKMVQVASRALQIPIELIYTSETSTDKIPNTSATAGSVGSDINGMAIIDACEKLNARLQPIKDKYPNDTWQQWIEKAYLERISLSATGYYKMPDIGYDPETNPNARMYSYYTNGVGVTMVEIDCLTGDHQVLSTDIVMDIGSSLNPAIDIGQIEGAFMQGYGLFTLEELRYSSEGCLYSRGPGMYKIPGFADIPGEFNVTLLTGAPNPRAVYSSKAVGEPPLFTACSAFFAIKEAITAARVEKKYSTKFRLYAPASSARIRMACEDTFTSLIRQNEEPVGSYVPWSVDP